MTTYKLISITFFFSILKKLSGFTNLLLYFQSFPKKQSYYKTTIQFPFLIPDPHKFLPSSNYFQLQLSTIAPPLSLRLHPTLSTHHFLCSWELSPHHDSVTFYQPPGYIGIYLFNHTPPCLGNRVRLETRSYF